MEEKVKGAGCREISKIIENQITENKSRTKLLFNPFQPVINYLFSFI